MLLVPSRAVPAGSSRTLRLGRLLLRQKTLTCLSMMVGVFRHLKI